jgi:hypothetical protein
VKRFFLNLGAVVLTLIPITSMLVMFEVVTFPMSHRYMGWLIAAYLTLVLVLLTRQILTDLWRWLQGGGR